MSTSLVVTDAFGCLRRADELVLAERPAWKIKWLSLLTHRMFPMKYLVREFRNCVSSLQLMLDENRDLLVALPNDHPVALGIALP